MIDKISIKGRLLNYIFLTNIPFSSKPTSKVWKNGLASFWENSFSLNSTYGSLWSPVLTDSHSHKDVNSIHLSIYGENILQNSGYSGWGLGCLNDTWMYIHDTAVSSNTVLTNNKDHVSKQGAGITENILTQYLDYGRADSGSALLNGKHYRNLVSVYPQDSKNSYFILFDEVNARVNTKVNIALHPSSSIYSKVTDKQEYSWIIKNMSPNNVYVNIFLATQPESVEIKNGSLCSTKNSIA